MGMPNLVFGLGQTLIDLCGQQVAYCPVLRLKRLVILRRVGLHCTTPMMERGNQARRRSTSCALCRRYAAIGPLRIVAGGSLRFTPGYSQVIAPRLHMIPPASAALTTTWT